MKYFPQNHSDCSDNLVSFFPPNEVHLLWRLMFAIIKWLEVSGEICSIHHGQINLPGGTGAPVDPYYTWQFCYFPRHQETSQYSETETMNWLVK